LATASVDGAEPLPPAMNRPVDFIRDVQPILSKHCYSCHGEKKQKAGLRLDQRPDALLAKILKPGHSDASRLIVLVAGADPDARMPPDGAPLSRQQVGLLRAWIDQGATWPTTDGDHWSLRPLIASPIPLSGSAAVANPIDAFILAKSKEKGLTPSPIADRRTLIRRLTFNLHGLPPTPQEINAFVADPAPNAYERLVERLLASPHYGERWARHWMDIAHFAETHGHDQDAVRENAWPYRDYLIRALNADKLYARFVQDQIAGDALFPEDSAAVAALGFLAAGPWDESSQKDIRDDTVDKLQAQYIDRDDMITTVFSAIASTSVHCARCHDHKFDPISQKEYYGLQAVFAGVERANRAYDPDARVARLRRELQQRRADIVAGRFDIVAQQTIVTNWEKGARLMRWKTLAASATARESTVEPRGDGSFFFTGTRPEKDTYTFVATTVSAITAIRLEVLTDPSLPHHGPGRQDNGNLHLSEVRVRIGDGTGKPISIVSAFADFNQAGWDITRAIDGNPATAWGIYPEVGKAHEAVFVLKETLPTGTRVTIELDQLHGGGHLIGRARLSATGDANPMLNASPLPQTVTAILNVAADKRTPEQNKELTKHVMLTRLDAEIAALPKPEMVYAAASDFDTLGSFKPPKGPRPVFMLKRGEVSKPGEAATPAALTMVKGPSPTIKDAASEAQRRAALALWLTGPDNGLVWRSIVNRVWHYHFGRGIVNTPNDFGRMGAAPTHPELLDWLAVWFRDRGGSLKDLHRLIVTSRTYQQVSADQPEQSRLDTDNGYLWRMNRERLDAESVRDAVLSVSGTIDTTMGGPSARHFTLSPGVHVTPVVDYQKFDLDSPGARRRSVYRFIFRTLPDPFYEALDCPDASQFTPVRAGSVTALQALALLNDRFTVRYAEHFAARLERESKDRNAQISRAYERALGRTPSDAEAKRLADFATRYGLPSACRLLFNCNEFLFVD
jgi:hypothetical protein